MTIRVLHGAAAEILRAVPAASVDMVYLDPPFGTQQVWTGKAGSFDDRFAWDSAARTRLQAIALVRSAFADLLPALPIAGRDRAYLVFLAELLLAVHRVAHPAAAIWLHCDDTMGAYIRLTLEAVFGPQAYLGTVIWKRSNAHSNTGSWGRVHDSIHVYGRSRVARWRLWRIRSAFAVGDPCGQFSIEGFSDIQLNPSSKERVGYPTQKPVALLESLIAAGSLPGGTVLDPTCGSGTTLVAASKIGRKAIGIDVSADACAVARRRIDDATRAPDLFAAMGLV